MHKACYNHVWLTTASQHRGAAESLLNLCCTQDFVCAVHNSIMVICLLSPVSRFTAAISCYSVLANAKCFVQSKVGWFLLYKSATIIDDTAFNSPVETILSRQVAFTSHTMPFSGHSSYACTSWPVVWAYVIWWVQLFELTVWHGFSLLFPTYMVSNIHNIMVAIAILFAQIN